MGTLDVEGLIDSWILHLRAERKADNTVKSYGTGVRAYVRWSAAEGRDPELLRNPVRAWVADLLDQGVEPSTAVSRLAAVKRFSAWLAEEGEIADDDLLTVKAPKLDVKVVPELTEDQVRALVKACTGGNDFLDRRDEAIVRLMLETAARAGEVVAMELDDIDLKAGIAIVRRGKGNKGRRVPFGSQTARAIDRYLRARKAHRLAASPAIWLGDRGKTLRYAGLHKALGARADAAGIPDFFPHVLRHTGAGRWLAAGGSEGGLMAVAGWSTRGMIDRYTRSTSERRAAEEARGLNLGDL